MRGCLPRSSHVDQPNCMSLTTLHPANEPDLPRPIVEACGDCGETGGCSPSPGGEGWGEGGRVSSHRDICFPSPSFGSWAQCANNVSGRSLPEGEGRGEGEALNLPDEAAKSPWGVRQVSGNRPPPPGSANWQSAVSPAGSWLVHESFQPGYHPAETLAETVFS